MPDSKVKYCTNTQCSYLLEKSNKNKLPKRLGLNDSHGLCLRCLGPDHNVRACGICKLFHDKTRKQRAKAVAAFVRSGTWPASVNSKSLDKERSRERSQSKSSSSHPDKVDKADQMADSMSELAKAYELKGYKTKKRSTDITPPEQTVPTLVPQKLPPPPPRSPTPPQAKDVLLHIQI